MQRLRTYRRAMQRRRPLHAREKPRRHVRAFRRIRSNGDRRVPRARIRANDVGQPVEDTHLVDRIDAIGIAGHRQAERVPRRLQGRRRCGHFDELVLAEAPRMHAVPADQRIEERILLARGSFSFVRQEQDMRDAERLEAIEHVARGSHGAIVDETLLPSPIEVDRSVDSERGAVMMQNHDGAFGKRGANVEERAAKVREARRGMPVVGRFDELERALNVLRRRIRKRVGAPRDLCRDERRRADARRRSELPDADENGARDGRSERNERLEMAVHAERHRPNEDGAHHDRRPDQDSFSLTNERNEREREREEGAEVRNALRERILRRERECER